MVASSPSSAEQYLLVCTSIVRDLIQAVKDGKEVNLNQLRNHYGKKYKMKGVPRLVDILAAVPEEWKDGLRGALRAKPVRTASGVSQQRPDQSCRALITPFIRRWLSSRSCANRIDVLTWR